MNSRRSALTCLSLTGAMAALATVVSTWTMPLPVATPPALSAGAAPVSLAQAPPDAPDDALPAAAPPPKAAPSAQDAPADDASPFDGLLYVLALVGTGLAAACRRDD